MYVVRVETQAEKKHDGQPNASTDEKRRQPRSLASAPGLINRSTSGAQEHVLMAWQSLRLWWTSSGAAARLVYMDGWPTVEEHETGNPLMCFPCGYVVYVMLDFGGWCVSRPCLAQALTGDAGAET